jgi:hypothetical protein
MPLTGREKFHYNRGNSYTEAVSLRIYKILILGQRVANLVEGQQKAGYKIARWDASSLSSGIYFCRLEVSGLKAERTKKMVLIR